MMYSYNIIVSLCTRMYFCINGRHSLGCGTFSSKIDFNYCFRFPPQTVIVHSLKTLIKEGNGVSPENGVVPMQPMGQMQGY